MSKGPVCFPQPPDGYIVPSRNHKGQTYFVTGWFPEGAKDNKIDKLHRAPALVLDFDLVDWVEANRLASGGEPVEEENRKEHLSRLKESLHQLSDESLQFTVREELLPFIVSTLVGVTGGSPTYITYSGYGCHVLLWLVDGQGYVDDSDTSAIKARGVNRSLVREINRSVGFNFADSYVHDAGTRLLRPPGSQNTKNPDMPREVVVIYAAPDSLFNLKEISSLFTGKEEPKKRKSKSPPVPPPPAAPGPTDQNTSGKFTNTNFDFTHIPAQGYSHLYHKMLLMRSGERENIVCPFSGQSSGSAFIVVPEEGETWDHRFRLVSNSQRVVYHNSFGFARVHTITAPGGRLFPRVDYTNIVRILQEDVTAPSLRWDERGLCGLIDGVRAGDREIRSQIISWIDTRYGRHPAKEAAFDAFNDVAQNDKFDPVSEWLNSLSWDGVSRLDSWLTSYCGSEDMDGLAAIYSRKFLVGSVARALSPGCKMDTMLVFVGEEQGAGKSSLIELLATSEFYGVGQIKPGDRDFLTQLQRTWFWEWGELSRLKHADIEVLKGFMTQRSDSWVPKYVRTEALFPRRVVFMGTTNKPEVLHDSTGSRRFWVIRTKEIDLNWFKENKDQLFAEAVVAYKAGEIWHLTQEEEKTRDAASVEFKEEDLYEDRVMKFAKVHPRGFKGEWLLDDMGITLEGYMRMRPKIKDTLTSLGFKYRRVRRGGENTRFWLRDDLLEEAEKTPETDNVYEYTPKPKAGGFSVDL